MADMMVAAMQQLPVGYRFHPTDEELLGHYLLRKNHGEEDAVCVIPEVDLYLWEPEELIRKFRESSIVQSKDPQWWFFCEQGPGRTQLRSTKGGFWKKTGPTRDVKTRYGRKQVIGSKKILTFFRGNSSINVKTDWIMHEFHPNGNAVGSLMRKNYVLCMIKCNSDEMANSTPAYVREWNNSDLLLQPEADDGSIPEHMVRARMQSLETLCRAPNHGGDTSMLAPFLEGSTNSVDSSRAQFWPREYSVESDSPLSSSELLVGDAMESDLPSSVSESLRRHCTGAWVSSSSSSEWSGRLEDILNWAPAGQDEHHCISEMQTLRNGTQAPEPVVQRRLELQASWGDNVPETLRPPEQPAVIMENKQSQKLETLYAFWPIDEKKGTVEDNSPRSTTSVRAEAPEVKIEKECLEIIPAAKVQRHAPIKIEEILVSAAGSSSTSIHKPRKPVTDATWSCTARGEETNAVAALSDHESPARELKLEATETEPVLCSCSRSIKQRSSSNLLMVYAQYLLVGIIFCVATFCEKAMAALSDHENPARELKLEATETEPVSCSCSRCIRQRSSSNLLMVYARNLLMGIIFCVAIICENAMAALSDHENPAQELKLEAGETEPVSCSRRQSIKQHFSSNPSMVYARNLLVGMLLCFVIFHQMSKPLIFDALPRGSSILHHQTCRWEYKDWDQAWTVDGACWNMPFNM